ncbi:MAG TPA: ergothioneine biosynthesis protein EgtB [Acidobacteriaceae bacterium]|jgi:ergothioneine biosynthesis protein EgtB|nr:ergothioneine biosynthesis protein EgtB [Acidobacteriaceae bacterium]
MLPLRQDRQSAAAPDTGLLARFRQVRAMTHRLTASLTPEDQMVQSCTEASPAKWHLAHTSWFFETFILREYLPQYQPYDPDFLWLFNSYYKSLGEHPEKRLRASFSRPSLDQVLAYRRHVEENIARLLEGDASAEARERIELGLHHEQQHQELIVTDMKHAFWSNPLQPVYAQNASAQNALPMRPENASPRRWFSYAGGLAEIGHNGDGFAFDNELSRHRVYLEPFRLASQLVTCEEYLAFIEDKGYRRPELWLSDGWDTVQAQSWEAPLYWHQDRQCMRSVFTLHGQVPLKELLATPVCHLSYYEADAFARWAGHRLPTEFEWEHAAAIVPVSGNLLESDALHPRAYTETRDAQHPAQLFGDVWEWTQSAYLAYPGYRPASGALGEYNGKFMSNQFVLRGGSAVTPQSHIRSTYRNFFAPATRWQFSGIRLAADGDPA